MSEQVELVLGSVAVDFDLQGPIRAGRTWNGGIFTEPLHRSEVGDLLKHLWFYAALRLTNGTARALCDLAHSLCRVRHGLVVHFSWLVGASVYR